MPGIPVLTSYYYQVNTKVFEEKYFDYLRIVKTVSIQVLNSLGVPQKETFTESEKNFQP